MNKSEFAITTISSLIVAAMFLGELVFSNSVAYSQGQFEEAQREVSLGSGASRMFEIVAQDCSKIKNDPGMTDLMLQHNITPQSDFLMPTQPVSPTPQTNSTHHRP